MSWHVHGHGHGWACARADGSGGFGCSSHGDVHVLGMLWHVHVHVHVHVHRFDWMYCDVCVMHMCLSLLLCLCRAQAELGGFNDLATLLRQVYQYVCTHAAMRCYAHVSFCAPVMCCVCMPMWTSAASCHVHVSLAPSLPLVLVPPVRVAPPPAGVSMLRSCSPSCWCGHKMSLCRCSLTYGERAVR